MGNTITCTKLPATIALPKIVQGTRWKFNMQLFNPDDSPMDLTNCTPECMMRSRPESRDVVFTPSVDVSGNAITFTILEDVTAAVTQTKLLYFNILITDSSNETLPYFEGTVVFEASVTR